jgi:cytochrome b pre-mRNA-processing protein 3
MFQWFRRRAETGRRAEELYGSVVTAARHPSFYRDVGVPDTPEGRFELVALHLFLALESVKMRGADTDLSRRTIESFVSDMDDCMREMGVGDMAVGKKVKRAAAAFYERAGAYRDGLAAQAPDLEESLRVYVFGEKAPRSAESPTGARVLGQYVRAVADSLSRDRFEVLVESEALSRLLHWSRNEGS